METSVREQWERHGRKQCDNCGEPGHRWVRTQQWDGWACRSCVRAFKETMHIDSDGSWRGSEPDSEAVFEAILFGDSFSLSQSQEV